MPKRRLSVTIERELLAAVGRSVERGAAPNLSAWVGRALALELERQARLGALEALLTRFQAEHGPLEPEELKASTRAARVRAAAPRRRRRA